MSRGKYAKFFDDRRQWHYTGGDANGICGAERQWRSEFLSCPENTEFMRFKEEPSPRKPPDRGGWSARYSKMSFRDKGHDKDPRTEHPDPACVQAWHKGLSRNPHLLGKAPVDIHKDRAARVSAALGALRHTEQALSKANQSLSENRDVVLKLLFGDFKMLKEVAKNLSKDRRHLLEDVHDDFTALRERARSLQVERKVLLQELQDEIHHLEQKAYEAQASREDTLVYLKSNHLVLEAYKEDILDDPKLEQIKDHWDQLEGVYGGLLDDREMIVQQVMRYWPGLNFVAQHVRDDRNILLEAVHPYLKSRTVEDVSHHASKSYLECEAILDVVMEDSTNLETMARKIRQSRVVVNKVIKDDWKNLEKAANVVRQSRALVVAVVDNTVCDGKW